MGMTDMRARAIGISIAIGLCVSSAERANATEGFFYDDHTFKSIILSQNPNSETTPWDINNAGQIVGVVDGNLIDGNSFLYYGGNYSTIRVPGSDLTGAFGINNSGQIVGAYDKDDLVFGFEYKDGVYTQISDPLGTLTQAYNINDTGEIIGIFQEINTGIETGFIYSAGNFTTLTYPGALQIFPYGINDSGEIVGEMYFGPVSGDQAFIYSNGVFSFLQVPIPGSSTSARGINNFGQVTGYYDIGGIRHGFIYSNGVYETIDYPSTDYTMPLGINDLGYIVGTYDVSGVSGVPEPPTWAMFLVGFGGLGVIIHNVRRGPRSAPAI
jgi:uncharacterized membrane protein